MRTCVVRAVSAISIHKSKIRQQGWAAHAHNQYLGAQRKRGGGGVGGPKFKSTETPSWGWGERRSKGKEKK